MKRAFIRISAELLAQMFTEGKHEYYIRKGLPADARFVFAHTQPGAMVAELYFDSDVFEHSPEGGPVLRVQCEVEIDA